MNNQKKIAPYLDSDFQRLTEMALRPGGRELTVELINQAEMLISKQTGLFALDLGCGAGLSLEILLERGYTVFGLDASADMLALAEQRTKGRARLLPGRAEDLDLPQSSLDLALCECVLSLCDRPQDVLGRLYRVIKPGGLLILADIYLRIDDASNYADGCLGGAVKRQVMQSRLEAAGFEVKIWTDYSRKLAELSARLILSGQQVKLNQWLGLDCGGGPANPKAYGYCAWLAQVPELA